MGQKPIVLRGWREPGHGTRCQQRDHAKLNVNHPANLPRSDPRRMAVKQWPAPNVFREAVNREEARLFGRAMMVAQNVQPQQDAVLTLGKLREAMKLMDAVPIENRLMHMRMDRLIPREFQIDAVPMFVDAPKAEPMHEPVTAHEIACAKSVATEAGKLCQALWDVYKDFPAFKADLDWNYAKQQPHYPAIQALMEKRGWSFSGGGYFSAVFVKGALAIKVGFKAEDSGAMYAAFCRDNPGMPGLPEIVDLQHHGRNSYTVILPKMTPLSERDKDRLNTANRNDQGLIGPAVLALGREWGISDAMVRIRTFFHGVAEMDLHGDNMMVDRNGRKVITDPVSMKKNK